jgi:predicted TIM-barrel enzyme/DNA-binding NtrC family response regulator
MRLLQEIARGRLTGDEPLVGAAIGVGMTAEAAERGGADFLLALNAGRYRVMGAASIAAMLPLDDSNRFTDTFARREILDQVAIPVFFGACAFNPQIDLSAFMREVADAGYHGVANFPTVTHYDGSFRKALEEAGIGYAREVEMLRQAKARGLVAFGYAKTRNEIQQMLDAKIDVICLNFGWNAGGSRGVPQIFTIEEAADRARRIIHQVRQVRPETICLVEGGPIVNPEDMYRVCRDARADGYVGGSTLDRLPLELSVMQVTSAFKAVSVLREADQAQSKEIARAARLAGVAGQSAEIRDMLAQAVRLAGTSLPVLVVGERGLGRTTLARSIHALGKRRGPAIVFNARTSDTDHEEFLFGAEPSYGRVRRTGAMETAHATIIIEDADHLSEATQRRCADLLERGEFERVGGERPVQAQARFVAIMTPATNGGGLLPELLHHFGASRIDVPALRDRPEDIPAYARLVLEAVGVSRSAAALEITADGMRRLFAHSWPDNTRELRRVVERAAVACETSMIGAHDIAVAIETRNSAMESRPPPMEEKEWILDALRRNRFRRGKTAQFLGLSRKTLYNKMRRHGLLE